MIKFLAADMSLVRTGWATHRDGPDNTMRLVAGSIIPEITSTTDGRTVKLKAEKRKNWIATQVVRTALEHGCRFVVLEDYPYGMQSSAVTKLAELGGVVRDKLYEAGLSWLPVSNSSTKLYATGSARGVSKQDMVDAAHDRLRYAGASHDEADALWLHALVADALGQGYVDDLAPRAHKAVAAIVARIRHARLLDTPDTRSA